MTERSNEKSMRGFVISFSHRLAILLVGSLVFSTPLLWAQGTSPPATFPIHSLATPAAFAKPPDAREGGPHLAFKLPLTVERNHGQTEPSLRFLVNYPGYYRLPLNINEVLDPTRRTAEVWSELWSIEKYNIGIAPKKWPTFEPTYSLLPEEKNYRFENLERLGQRVPFAGFIIVRISQQAKAHPRVTRVLTMIQPQL